MRTAVEESSLDLDNRQLSVNRKTINPLARNVPQDLKGIEALS